MIIPIKYNDNIDVIAPKKYTIGASGYDLHCDVGFVIYPRCRVVVNTGLSVSIPVGFEMQIRSRSGMAIKDGVVVLNAPGTIDSDYRGTICVILINHSDSNVFYKKGARIAQAVICPIITDVTFKKVDSLDKTSRDSGKFGSTDYI